MASPLFPSRQVSSQTTAALAQHARPTRWYSEENAILSFVVMAICLQSLMPFWLCDSELLLVAMVPSWGVFFQWPRGHSPPQPPRFQQGFPANVSTPCPLPNLPGSILPPPPTHSKSEISLLQTRPHESSSWTDWHKNSHSSLWGWNTGNYKQEQF